MDFEGRYKQLNASQKRAVDAIDGPVMVIAGPGTGKTELLSVRVANILKQTDALPESILCLTYTDSGADAMRRRLIEIIGADAYRVAIHTFHSFGAEVINQNPAYFFNGADFQAADDLVTYEVLHGLFEALPLNHPFASTMNGAFTFQKDAKSTIEDLKKAGLTPEGLREVLAANQPSIESAQKILGDMFEGRLAPAILDKLEAALVQLQTLSFEQPPYDIPAWLPLLTASLTDALAEARDHPKTTPPIREWRDAWFTKIDGSFALKALGQQEKLGLMADLYEGYLVEMQRRERYDFDDMILQVVNQLEIVDDLRYNLQEKYQYFLVDEFQDTNLAQLRIVHLLTDSPVNEGKPNVFVVGDPDQAIYSFQGADSSNLLSFAEAYPAVQQIILTENYRSTQGILNGSREIILKSSERLAERSPELNQPLQAQSKVMSAPQLFELPSTSDESAWIAAQIKARIDQGTEPTDIAILMLNHADLQGLLPHLSAAGIPVTYERRDDVLALPPIQALVQLAEVVCLLSDQRLNEANALLPEILSHPAWGFSSEEIWELSSLSHRDHLLWLDTMRVLPSFELWRNWLLELVTASEHTSLEEMIDRLLGVPDQTSLQPAHTLYDYYFSPQALESQPASYLECVEGLISLREKLLAAQPSKPTLRLSDFAAFIQLHQQAGVKIPLARQVGNDAAVHVMTAHKSKGLEFDHVYVAGVTQNRWKAGSNRSNLGYPENLKTLRIDTSADERLRLFYVAMTRAKHNLTISYSTQNTAQKALLPASFLVDWEAAPVEAPNDPRALTQQALVTWHQQITEPVENLRDFLAPQLEKYHLTATDLTHFLDLTYGGPQDFVIKSLLKFPSAGSASAKYGNAIHATLCALHTEFLIDQKAPNTKAALQRFERELREQWLSDEDFAAFREKGIEELTAYLAKHDSEFSTSQQPELNLSRQDSQLGEVHLGGRLDLIDIDRQNQTISVLDYKTGATETAWRNSSGRLHKYRQQLMFYKLLLEHSRDYHNYTVASGAIDFLKPAQSGEVIRLELAFAPEELERFERLATAVWQHIVDLNLPDTSHYSADLKGTLAFEQDLIDGVV